MCTGVCMCVRVCVCMYVWFAPDASFAVSGDIVDSVQCDAASTGFLGAMHAKGPLCRLHVNLVGEISNVIQIRLGACSLT